MTAKDSRIRKKRLEHGVSLLEKGDHHARFKLCCEVVRCHAAVQPVGTTSPHNRDHNIRHRALQWNHAVRTRAYQVRRAGGYREPWHQARTLALAGRYVARPVHALTTATARVVPFAYACDGVRHCCSFIGVIGLSATPRACSFSPSLPPEAPSLGRHYPASTVLRASPPPCPARPCPHGSSVGACHATGRASRVASTPPFHTCRRHYPGGAGRCLHRSLPDPWQPSPSIRRVGFRITCFEACTAFITLRPAWALSRPRRPVASECFRRCRYLHHPLRLLPAGATVAGRDSHPLRNGALRGALIDIKLSTSSG